MLKISPLKNKVGRVLAVVKDEDQSVGLLNIVEHGGENLVELPHELCFCIAPETRENLVDTIFITGVAGSGKSVWSGNYCKLFIKMFKSK